MINPLKNWKPFWAGVVMISGGASGLFYAYKGKTLDPTVITTCLGSIGGGLGMLFARQSNVSSVDVGIEGVVVNSKGDHVVTPIGPKASEDIHEKLPEIVAETKEAQIAPKG